MFNFLHTKISCISYFCNRVVDSFKSTFLDFQRSDFNIIKVHLMTHFTNCIQRSGLPWEYSTNQYEQMHIVLMKTAYRASNKRAATL
jgi:hypothetical protein